MQWITSRRRIPLDRSIVMGILNVTPDSFSDGGRFADPDRAVDRVAEMIGEGADVIDIGGESTRPDSKRISAAAEIDRVIPVIEAIASRFDVPVSIDTSKSEVARVAVAAGAEIINDISGFKFDPEIANVAAESCAGVVLMHLRGTFETMHTEPPVADVCAEVSAGWRSSIGLAFERGIGKDKIALDIGLGFSKTFHQNLELIAKLGTLVNEFADHPVLVGASRKSFIGKVLGGAPPDSRLGGSLAAAALAVRAGARIVRVHDVSETVRAVRFAEAVRSQL